MSAAIVRLALEISSAGAESQISSADVLKAKNKRKKDNLIQKKKKKATGTGDQILKQNLKILKALESLSASRYPVPLPKTSTLEAVIPPPATTQKSRKSSKKRKTKNQTSQELVFTDEDFTKFESEYFVAD